MIGAVCLQKALARSRLQDVLKLAELSDAHRREVCYLVSALAPSAGYSAAATEALTDYANSRFRRPLSDKSVRAISCSAAEHGERRYRNATLVSWLGIDAEEEHLQLLTIMTPTEKRRRKAVRNAAEYRRRRGGEDKREKVRKRRAAMVTLMLSGTLERQSFCGKYGISKSTYYADKKAALKTVQLLLVYLLAVVNDADGRAESTATKTKWLKKSDTAVGASATKAGTAVANAPFAAGNGQPKTRPPTEHMFFSEAVRKIQPPYLM